MYSGRREKREHLEHRHSVDIFNALTSLDMFFLVEGSNKLIP